MLEVGVTTHVPPAGTMTDSVWLPTVTVTVLLTSPVPVMVGVLSLVTAFAAGAVMTAVGIDASSVNGLPLAGPKVLPEASLALIVGV